MRESICFTALVSHNKMGLNMATFREPNTDLECVFFGVLSKKKNPKNQWFTVSKPSL